MNLELTLMELNDLYYVVSKGVESHKELVEIAKRTTPELEKYFEKEENQSGEFANAYLLQNIIANYYQNNRLLKKDVLQIINKNILKENQEVIQILRENTGNLEFYENRNMIIRFD